MKKLLLIPALLATTLAMADQKKYEISPMVGYNFSEGNLNVKTNGFYTGGLEVQFNDMDSKIIPEFSFYKTPRVDKKTSGTKTVTRGAFNGVYTYESSNALIPFTKAGIGIENDGVFFDAGAGFKVPLSENIALKAEAIYMAKLNDTTGVGFADSNLMTLVGVTFAFGGEKPQEVPQTPVVQEEPEPTPAPKPVVVVEKDSDGDGVLDKNDRCPNTPKGDEVDNQGCSKVVQLEIYFEYNSAVVQDQYGAYLDKYALFLKNHPEYLAHIVGHTDNIGSQKFNIGLSQRRAKSVVDALVARGVDAKRLSYEGVGKLEPIATNKTAEGRAKNRRIEEKLTKH